jgi:hypothetical protein
MWKSLREKPRNARQRIIIIGRSITIHERINPLCAINIVELSYLFYDYLALYKGANNSLSWRTRNKVVDVLRLARLTCRSPLGLLSVIQQVNRILDRPGTKTRNSRVKRVTRNSTRLDSNSV